MQNVLRRCVISSSFYIFICTSRQSPRPKMELVLQPCKNPRCYLTGRIPFSFSCGVQNEVDWSTLTTWWVAASSAPPSPPQLFFFPVSTFISTQEREVHRNPRSFMSTLLHNSVRSYISLAVHRPPTQVLIEYCIAQRMGLPCVCMWHMCYVFSVWWSNLHALSFTFNRFTIDLMSCTCMFLFVIFILSLIQSIHTHELKAPLPFSPFHRWNRFKANVYSAKLHNAHSCMKWISFFFSCLSFIWNWIEVRSKENREIHLAIYSMTNSLPTTKKVVSNKQPTLLLISSLPHFAPHSLSFTRFISFPNTNKLNNWWVALLLNAHALPISSLCCSLLHTAVDHYAPKHLIFTWKMNRVCRMYEIHKQTWPFVVSNFLRDAYCFQL